MTKRWWGLLVIALLACGKTGGGAKPRVAVSIFPLWDVARRLGGDRLDVVLVLPPGRSEHDYDPTAKEVAKLADAKLGIAVGLGMDDWLSRIVKGASPSAEIVTLGDKVDPLAIELEEVGAEEGEHEEEHHHEEGGKDPHFWLDPERMQKATDLMAEAFAKLDPEGAEGYRTRAAEVKRSLGDLDAQLKQRSAGWTKKTIVTFHGSMAYFAKRYGLTIAAVIEPFPGKEPTPKYIAEVLAAIQKTGAAALFSEPQLDEAPAKVIANQAGIPLHQLDPVGGGPGAEGYEKLLTKNADVLDRALR